MTDERNLPCSSSQARCSCDGELHGSKVVRKCCRLKELWLLLEDRQSSPSPEHASCRIVPLSTGTVFAIDGTDVQLVNRIDKRGQKLNHV